MKKVFAAALLLFFCCACGKTQDPYTAEQFDLFDTVITVTAYCDTRAEFDALRDTAFSEFARLDKLFDIYEGEEGSVKTLNEHAGMGPVPLAPEVLALLSFSKDAYELTDGSVNVMMGAVLSLWHDARTAAEKAPESAALPDRAALKAAAKHCDISALVINQAGGTAELTDAEASVDVGAVAKGYAVEQVAQNLMAEGFDCFLISAGGNVRAHGIPPGKEGWRVGVQSPTDASQIATVVTLTDGSVVTSGGYLRYFEVDGVRYHHIIDPVTLMPADAVLSATVLCEDSGIADALSTAFFMRTADQAKDLEERLTNTRVIRIEKDGTLKDEGEYRFAQAD